MFAQEAEIKLPEVTTYIPAAVEQKLVITAEDIEAAHYESLGELVECCGIQMLYYGPYGLDNKASIRGFTDETVRVVIDGICVNNAQYGTFDLSTINLDAVEKIEIVRGGFTEGVEDEGAVGGVIYITMKKMELKNSLTADSSLKTFFNKERPLDSVFQMMAFEGRLGESTFLTSNGTLNFATNRYLYKIGKTGSLLDGPFGGAVTTGKDGHVYQGKPGVWRSAENAQVTDGHAAAYLTHYFGDGNYFSFGEMFYGGHKNTPGAVNSHNQGLQRDYDNNFSFTMWNPAVACGLFNMKNSMVWLCNNRFYKEAATDESRHFINTVKYTGNVDFTSLVGGRLQQTAGVTADFTNLNSTNDGVHFQVSGVFKETTKFAAGGGWSFSVPLAAKLCVNDTVVNFAFVPKAGAAWEKYFGETEAAAGVKIRLSADVYRMVQFPNMDDLFWQGGGFHGNPNLKPESGWGADLGFSVDGVRIGKSSQLGGGLTVFSDYYKDKIKWGSGTTENLSSVFYLGVDFDFSADFFDNFWTLDLNGEYLYNSLLDKNDEYTYGCRIMWTPDLVCNLSSSLNFELARLTVSATYTGRRYTDNMNLYYLKPYVLVNLAAETVPIRGKISPYIKIDNLLNWQYQSVEGYSMPGISLTLGARVKFF